MDAKMLLAKKMIRDAEKILNKSSTSKKKRKEHYSPEFKKNAVHPFKRIDWHNKIKFYVTAIVATSNDNCRDGSVITEDALKHSIVSKNNFTFPVFYNYTEEPIGSARIDGVDKLKNIATMKAQTTLITTRNMAEEISENKYVCVLDFKILKAIKLSNGIRRIDEIEIISIALIPKKDSVDKMCKIIDIYKDEDIDKKLEA